MQDLYSLELSTRCPIEIMICLEDMNMHVFLPVRKKHAFFNIFPHDHLHAKKILQVYHKYTNRQIFEHHR